MAHSVGWRMGGKVALASLLLELPFFFLLFSKPILCTHPSGDPTSLYSSSELLTLLGWDRGTTDRNGVWSLLCCSQGIRGKEHGQRPPIYGRRQGTTSSPRGGRVCLWRLGSGAWDSPLCATCFVPQFPFAFSVVVEKVLQNGALSRASVCRGRGEWGTSLGLPRAPNVLQN